MKRDLTEGNVAGTMLVFSGPMILGNLLQQCYNIADTLIVGKVLGADALAAVGSAYTLMTFLTSIIIGLCMGSSAVFSVYFGKKERKRMKDSMTVSLLFIAAVTVVMNIAVFAGLHPILRILQVPAEIYELMREYVRIIFCGLIFVFLYNYFAFLLRSIGNSVAPLCFLGVSTVINVILDVMFVMVLKKGVGGAAFATVLAQIVSGIGIGVYVWTKEPWLRPGKKEFMIRRNTLAEVVRHSTAACVQQSVMNFGILMIQGLVNSFGTAVMAAFAAAVKIDSFAYMPAQEFGNAFSLFISQNHGAGKGERVREGIRQAVKISVSFCLAVSLFIFLSAPFLMQIFVKKTEAEVIRIGSEYLRIEGVFYCGIGLLFLLYGFYRGVEKPEMSLVLTVISLGTRVLLAYLLSPIPFIGVKGIWWAIPIGWFLADVTGVVYYEKTDTGTDFGAC